MKSSKCKVQSLPLQILSRGSNLKKTNNLFFILLLFFSLFTFHFSLLTSSSLARDIASQRECAVCHIEWLEELRRKDVTPLVEIPQTPVMIRGRQGVVSTERMCFTCHDGYVNDSRFAFDSEKHRHPVYVKPSDKIKIPATREGKQVFPLNLKGEIYCGTCHSAHGRSWDDMGDKTKTLFLREPTENSAICLACHIDRAMGPKEGMHPFFKTGKIAKLPTEELEELGARIGTTKEGAGVICQSCHRIKGAPEKKLLIIKNDNSELCGLCHADRYTHTREEAAQRSTHPVNILSDKIDISKKAVELGSKTGTNGKIICQTCHRPHYAEKGGKILVRKASSDSGFCKICHEDKKTVEITKHNIAVMSPENKNAKDIPARESGPCGACHFAHSGKGPKLWARETKEGNDPFERLCLSCHSKGSVAEKKTILSGPYSHPVGVNIKKLGASTDLPLFDENGLLTGKKDEGNVLCNTCHNVHQWDPLDPNRASRKDEEGDGSTSFLRKPVQVFSDLCLECHKDKIKVRETKHDMAVMSKDLKDIRGENVLKGAGVCGGCHVPHNGKGPKMWAQEIKFGRSPIEGMCLSCHNEDGIAQKKPVGKNSHPIGEDVKKLGVALNTKLPLFTAEGMRTGKGNEGLVTCFTCHDPHQWNPQDLADKGGPGIEGDGKTSFLRARNEDSNLCGECHADRYTRTREEAIKKGTHPVNITSQKVDIQGKVAEIGGMLGKDGAIICQSCHAVHNAVSKRLLVKANTDNASFCKICHEDKKTVEITKHNIAVMFPDDKNAKGIPAKESGPCGSCHFAHGGKGPKLWAREMKEGNDPFERLCLSCHSKGSVAEKKSILSGPYSHPVGVNIKKLGASTDLPLFDENGLLTGKKDDGNVLCNTCHNVHQWDPSNPNRASRKDEEGDGSTSFLRKQIYAFSDLCFECHKDKIKIKDTKHDIALMTKDLKGIRNADVLKSGGVCGGCHVPHNGKGPRMWAQEIKSGIDPINGMCLSCHNEGGIGQKKVIGINNSHPVGADVRKLGIALNTKLPLFTAEGARTGKGSEGLVTCFTCHDPHQWNPENAVDKGGPGIEGAGTNSFLRIAASEESLLCGECHRDRVTVHDTKHDLRFTAKDSRNAMGADPFSSGVCGGCHVPHNGDPIKLWARKEMVHKGDAISNLCLSCHKAGGVAEGKQTGDVSHPVNVSLANLDIQPAEEGWISKFMSKLKGSLLEPVVKKLPLFNEKGEKNIKGNIVCTTCHDPHRWDPKSADNKGGAEIEGDGTNSFLRMPNSPDSGLCKNCHVDKRPVLFSKHNLNYSGSDEKNVMGSTVKDSGACSACHVPHNGKGFKLWAREIGKDSNIAEDLCKSCHSEGGPAREKKIGSPSHPTGVALKKGMEDVPFPLFNKEGRRDNKDGKLTCMTCHDPHQWDAADINSEKGASKDAEGDGTNSFLRQNAAPNSSICLVCHQDKKYVKGTDHDMNITNPSAKNIKEQTVSQSGVCGQCHYVHNAESSLLLWARKEGEGQDSMERLCRSCHADGQAGEAKQPVKFNHPKNVTVVSSSDVRKKQGRAGGDYPLFTEDGKRSEAGNITCPTCHNPHQWEAGKADYGPGKNVEGRANNSFLRNRSAAAPCADCHGMDGLFRYKYFHGETSRDKVQRIQQ